MKKRVLFVCLGNAVRSQMAEGFARVYGWDCVTAASSGLVPASRVDPLTLQLMSDIGIDVVDQFPKHYQAFARMEFDLIVNISGRLLPGASPKAPVIDWDVEDPVGLTEDRYRETRDLIQKLTLGLVDELRKQKSHHAAASESAVQSTYGPLVLDRKRRLRQSS